MDDTVAAEARLLIDRVHEADPEGAELAYADSAEKWIQLVFPDAGHLERLAARCQHLERWSLPRSEFPPDRAGYLRWRTTVHGRQGERAAELLTRAGAALADAEAVRKAVAKQAKSEPLAQALEDVACLIFLDEQIDDFASAHQDYSEEKWLGILRKTWNKMSPCARDLALQLELSPAIAALLGKALSPDS